MFGLKSFLQLDEILTNMWCIDSLIAFRKIDEDKAIKQCEISNASVELELVTSTETEESCELFEAERSSAQRKNETTPSNRKPSYAARKRILACDSDSEPVCKLFIWSIIFNDFTFTFFVRVRILSKAEIAKYLY